MPAVPTALPPGHGHVIVCGVAHLGLRTIDELRRRDEDVVAIADDGDASDDLAGIGVRLVIGDPLLARTLRDADIERAAAIVMTGDDDLTNLNIALAANELRPDIRIVLRMFDTELGAHIPDLFADGVALSSSALAAPGFVSAALDGETGGRFELAGRVLLARAATDPPRGARSIPIARLHDDRSVDLLPDVTGDDRDLVMVDVVLPDEERHPDHRAAAAGGTTRSIGRAFAALRDRLRAPEERLLRFTTVLVFLAVASTLYFELITDWGPLDAVSYAMTLLTGASLPVAVDLPADPAALQVYAILLSIVGAILIAIVYAFITDAMIRSRLLQTLGARTVSRGTHDHVVVAGLGAIGYRVALGLRDRGVPVVVVEAQDDGRFVSATRAADIPVVIGDARHRDVLDDVGLARARALVCATSDDLVNLSTALNGRAIRPDLRVVVRLFDPDFAMRVQRGFGIRFTRSVSQLAGPAFAAAATRTEVVAAVPVGDRRMALFARLRVPAGSALEGVPAASLDAVGAVRLLAVADPGVETARWDIPDDEILDVDEEVVVVATRAGLADLLHRAATPLDLTAPASALR